MLIAITTFKRYLSFSIPEDTGLTHTHLSLSECWLSGPETMLDFSSRLNDNGNWQWKWLLCVFANALLKGARRCVLSFCCHCGGAINNGKGGCALLPFLVPAASVGLSLFPAYLSPLQLSERHWWRHRWQIVCRTAIQYHLPLVLGSIIPGHLNNDNWRRKAWQTPPFGRETVTVLLLLQLPFSLATALCSAKCSSLL